MELGILTEVEEETGPGIGEGGAMVILVVDGRADGVFSVVHMGGCDVISHGGLGRLVVVVVVARIKLICLCFTLFNLYRVS